MATRLRVAKQLQMRSMASAPQLKPKAPAASASLPTGAAASRKLCAECKCALTGLPQRCSNCKMTYYCSKECQKAAWPAHKAACKPAGGVAKTPGGGSSNGGAATAATSSSAGAAAAGEQATTTTTTSSSHPPQSMQEALVSVLQESAAAKTDGIESRFETAVMKFLRGEYRAAIDLLLEVQGLARAQQQTAMEGEVYKWLGHCWGKLIETKKAETYFTEGVRPSMHMHAKLESCTCTCTCIARGN